MQPFHSIRSRSPPSSPRRRPAATSSAPGAVAVVPGDRLAAGIRGGRRRARPASTLTSDVITNVTTPAPCTADGAVPDDLQRRGPGRSMRIVVKDAGTATPTTPSANNDITIDRYRVEYTRADGRNTPGVDVPYAFDGAITVTITASADLVRIFSWSAVRPRKSRRSCSSKNSVVHHRDRDSDLLRRRPGRQRRQRRSARFRSISATSGIRSP